MAGSSETLHESSEKLSEETVDRHRAIASLMEELEAVDWYDQRVEACSDDSLRTILAHNRDEEKEHAAMVLEWLRRRDERMDRELRETLFTTGEIAHEAETATAEEEADGGGDGSLGIGSLKHT